MIRVRPERFPPGTFWKLQTRGMGPFEVLSKVGDNGYVIDIPNDWGIHSTFNVEDLVAYKGSIALPSKPPHELTIESTHTILESTPNPYPEPSTRHYRTDIIESILDDQVTVTRGGSYQRYLVRWVNRSDSENTWISRDELRKMAPDLLEFYDGNTLGSHSTGSSSSYPGRIDGDIRYPCTRSRARARAQQSAYVGLWMDDTCPAPDPPTSHSSRANPT